MNVIYLMNMNESNSGKKQEAPNSLLEMRARYRQAATELQRKVAEAQGARFEMSVLLLMRRSKDNIELVDAMRDFLNALENRSMFGQEDEPLGKTNVRALTDFFEEAKEKMEDLWGNRTARSPKSQSA